MLKIEGYNIYFKHKPNEVGYTVSTKRNGLQSSVPFKGVTECHISKDDVDVTYAVATCGLGDLFNKATGRKLSLARALKIGGFDRDFRTKVWDEYRKMVSRL